MGMRDGPGVVACVEVGGSGSQTVTFGLTPDPLITSGVEIPDGALVLIAVPGIIDGARVVAASNLGWYDVDPAQRLGLSSPPALVLNDAHAQALGEAVLRDHRRTTCAAEGQQDPDDKGERDTDAHVDLRRGVSGEDELVYVTLGTGVGGASVVAGRVMADNLLGHLPGFSDRACRCGEVGCLETVAAGWALSEPVPDDALPAVAAAVARAIDREPTATAALVVVAGGLVRRYPSLMTHLDGALPGRTVEQSHAPPRAKSAAVWGLLRAAGLSPLPAAHNRCP